MFDLSITQVTEMVEEFLGKMRMGCIAKLKHLEQQEEEFDVRIANETFLRQKIYNYFRRILGELNNPKRKKGQSRMIFTTHMDVYTENQDISFLPQIIQFYVVLNWARKYYDKNDFQRAVEPLRKLIKIRPDFGLGYKWLARSLKKIRRYDEAMQYYEKYAEVDNSPEAWLDLAQSYRKGKLFEKSEEIYQNILKENPMDREARMGMAQIKYARNDPEYLAILEEIYNEDENWLRKWLKDEFNFRIYISPKSLLTPNQAARYLGYERVADLTQKAFRNEIPSHFNPSRARISFFKEELDNWAQVMNRFQVLPQEIVLYPENIKDENILLVEVDVEGDVEEAPKEEVVEQKPEKMSKKAEELIRQILMERANREKRIKEASREEQKTPLTRRRDVTQLQKTIEEVKRTKRQGRPAKETLAANAENPSEQPEEAVKKRGRPSKKSNETPVENTEKKKRGRPKKKPEAEDDEFLGDGQGDEIPVKENHFTEA
ncbi:MAG: hypothetical protein Kow0042_28440 [Calditrichia bacterium]